jgi:ATP-dependent exoDNAse (exonuclease V) beta subunit
VENRRTQENEASDVVRIMNIHQSKGLGFDMVIVSGLDSKGGGNDGSNLLLGPSAKDVKWGFLPPAKDFCILDDVLRNQLEAQEADSKYGELCTAYVALTRAKKALYVVTTELSEGTAAKNFARHLMLQFHAASARLGNSNWHLAHELRDSIEPSEAASAKFVPPIQGTPKPVSPSSFKSASAMAPGAAQVSLGAAELGTEVHEALALIEWMGESSIETTGISAEAGRLIHAFFEKPVAKEVFQNPKTPHELWRERAFDVVLDGQWVSGVFDRVAIELSADGSPASATIYDFKTDHGTDSEIEERYRGQMEAYRAAASKLLRLPVESIKASIVRVR